MAAIARVSELHGGTGTRDLRYLPAVPEHRRHHRKPSRPDHRPTGPAHLHTGTAPGQSPHTITMPSATARTSATSTT